MPSTSTMYSLHAMHVKCTSNDNQEVEEIFVVCGAIHDWGAKNERLTVKGLK